MSATAIRDDPVFETTMKAKTEDESVVFARDLHEREVLLTATLQHILELADHDHYQHWGINE
jgi:hypothetical protein